MSEDNVYPPHITPQQAEKMPTYADAVMKQQNSLKNVTSTRDGLSELVVLQMNRKGRRGVAKANGGARIVGSNRPFLKTVID